MWPLCGCHSSTFFIEYALVTILCDTYLNIRYFLIIYHQSKKNDSIVSKIIQEFKFSEFSIQWLKPLGINVIVLPFQEC